MSRTAAATPPPPFFPQRNSTPTMRDASGPNVSAAHFPRHQANHFKKRAKQAFRGGDESDEFLAKEALPSSDNGLGLSFFEPVQASKLEPESMDPIFRTDSVTSVATWDSALSNRDSLQTEGSLHRSSFAPSISGSAASFVLTPLVTPASSRPPSLIQTDVSIDSTLPSPVEPHHQEIQASFENVPQRGSWVPNFGKMAKAVVHHGMNISPFGEKRSKKVSSSSNLVTPSVETPLDATFVPQAIIPQPTQEELQRLDVTAAHQRRVEYANEQRERVQECARLCSQWPQSGYHQLKWGPNGSRHFYEPQSYSNPGHVANVMQRQAELERRLCEESALFYVSRRHSATPSDDSSTEPTNWSRSSRSSLTDSTRLSADLSAAMSDSLLSNPDSFISQSELAKTHVKRLSEVRSLNDLRALSMDVDQLPQAPAPTRSHRAQSIGAKRPLANATPTDTEEEKRRKVDEAMVVEEAVQTGVIQPAQKPTPVYSVSGQNRQLSASTPNLGAQDIASSTPAVFGHVVKTSDTHPIIISNFFPPELIPIISQNAIPVPPEGSITPTLLGSKIDVPSLLLSFVPTQVQGQPGILPPPIQTGSQGDSDMDSGFRVGNLLLSSCPGKRLRMEGPVKGRGPVCRDLATDLRRIKSEGVGCLVCCLDDNELSLLGVPWETYREVASDIGLDVIRLPMPDGFTPVSMSLFDAQVNLIASKYSLRGINVLVHCRGGVGRAGLTASAWAIKMGFVTPHPSLTVVEEAVLRRSNMNPSALPGAQIPAELEHQIVMSMVERVIAMIRSRRGLKAIESFEQVQFLASYVKWLRSGARS